VHTDNDISFRGINCNYRVFHRVLAAVTSRPFYHLYVKQPRRSSPTPTQIQDSPKFYPFFKDAIGAIDGTHVLANPGAEDRPRYRNHKGEVSQNVLSACSFDMRFIYVLSGWEGSASDSLIFNDAVHSRGLRIPNGKYLLADAGFAARTGLLVPYRGVRYHLREWALVQNNRPSNHKELFNLRHSQLRNVIERAFGVLKRRFRVLKDHNEYDTKTQAQLVPALCAIHNFIMTFDPDDIGDLEEGDATGGDNGRPEDEADGDEGSSVELRDGIALRMWEQYQGELRQRRRIHF
jgi:hypothetical protein